MASPAARANDWMRRDSSTAFDDTGASRSCGMCCARLLEGSVDQSTQIFLTEEQEQQGYVLLCQARPRSDAVLMMCTDDEIDPL